MKFKFEEKIKEYKNAQEALEIARSSLFNTPDGFKYITCTRCYGSMHYDEHVNRYSVQELCNEYYGDNGIIDIWTTSKIPFDNYGDVTILTDEQMEELDRSDISMSQAFLNNITKLIKD